MKITSKVMTVVALCVGIAPMVTAATLRFEIVKTDPATRKKTWSYQIRSKKQDNPTVQTSQLKTFTRFTKISINDSNYENTLRVYPNRTGASTPGGAPLYKELTLTPQDIAFLNNKSYGLTLDKDANFSFKTIDEIKKLIAGSGPAVLIEKRKIKVERVGLAKGTLTIKLFKRNDDGTAGENYGLEKITGKNKDISIPANIPFSMKITGTGVNKTLNFSQKGSAALDVLYLDDEGRVTSKPTLQEELGN